MLNLPLVLVGFGAVPHIDGVAPVAFIFQHVGDGTARPAIGIVQIKIDVSCTKFLVGVGSCAKDFFPYQPPGDLAWPHTAGAHGEDAAHHRTGLLVRGQPFPVGLVLAIAVGRSGPNRSPRSALARNTARTFLLESRTNHSLNKFLNGISSLLSPFSMPAISCWKPGRLKFAPVYPLANRLTALLFFFGSAYFCTLVRMRVRCDCPHIVVNFSFHLWCYVENSLQEGEPARFEFTFDEAVVKQRGSTLPYTLQSGRRSVSTVCPAYLKAPSSSLKAKAIPLLPSYGTS